MFLIGQVTAIIDILKQEDQDIIINNSINLNIKGAIEMGKQQFNGIKIYRRKDGRYFASKQINGERTFFNGNTQEEVYNQLKEAFPKKMSIKKDLSFYEFWEYWYNKYKKPNYREDTLKNYRSVLRNQLLPNFKDKPIKKISSAEINELINKIEFGRMKEYASQFLRDCFKIAYREGKIKFDIWEEIKPYHHKRGEGKALTKEERKILLQNTKKINHGDLFEFYLFTGARPGEALNFKPSGIESEFIHLKGTKTEKSDRWIPKLKQVDEILKRQDLTQERVFNISEATRKRELAKLTKLCGFKFKTKDLRTTFGTMLAEMGMSDEIIAKWMGHTSTTTTKKYYIKVLSDFEKEQKTSLESKIRHTFDTLLDE